MELLYIPSEYGDMPEMRPFVAVDCDDCSNTTEAVLGANPDAQYFVVEQALFRRLVPREEFKCWGGKYPPLPGNREFKSYRYYVKQNHTLKARILEQRGCGFVFNGASFRCPLSATPFVKQLTK